MLTQTPTFGKAEPRTARLTTTQAARRLHALAGNADLAPAAVVAEVVEVTAGLTGALGAVFLSRDPETRRLAIQPGQFSPPHLAHLRSLLQQIARLGNVAAAEETAQADKAETGEQLVLVAVPVIGSTGNEALAAAISVDSAEQSRATAAYLTQLLTWAASLIGPLRDRANWHETADRNADLRKLNKLCSDAAAADSFRASGQLIANWVRSETKSSIVAVGVRRGWQRHCHIVGYSGSREFDERSENARTITELLEESVIATANGEIDMALVETAAVNKLRRVAGLEVAARYPLNNSTGEAFGAIVCLGEVGAGARTYPLPEEAECVIGQQLSLLQAAEPNPVLRKLGIERSGQEWYRQPMTWMCLIGLSLLMLCPMPLRVKCGCLVQPKLRRFVSVPYEGRLEEALARPGEIVKRGQMLARMDGREIEYEISGLTAELQRYGKERDTAMASFDTSAAQIAAIEGRRLQLKIEVLNERLDNLEIRSPVDGIVMGGDPRKLEGARLSLGQTLLEVGPAEQMLVELEVPDEDIAHIAENQSVRYRLSASPWKTYAGTIKLVHPRSELRDDKNVFIAEVELENADRMVRPGMQGRASIRAAWHPLGWNLFHKAWDSLVTWISW